MQLSAAHTHVKYGRYKTIRNPKLKAIIMGIVTIQESNALADLVDGPRCPFCGYRTRTCIHYKP